MSALAPMSTLEFLESLPAEPDAAVSEAERLQIQTWAVAHPDALGALVLRTLGLQGELALARREIDRLERARRMGRPSVPSPDELRRQSEAWDSLLGTRAGRQPSMVLRAAGSSGASAAVPGMTGVLPGAQAMAQDRPHLPRKSSRTFEDIGVRFLTDHAGKVWLALALLSALVVFIQERGV